MWGWGRLRAQPSYRRAVAPLNEGPKGGCALDHLIKSLQVADGQELHDQLLDRGGREPRRAAPHRGVPHPGNRVREGGRQRSRRPHGCKDRFRGRAMRMERRDL